LFIFKDFLNCAWRCQAAADSVLEAAGIALSGRNGNITMDTHVVHHTRASE